MTLQSISKVKIINWRSWKGETVLYEIKEGFNILIGPNAIGKSGVWEAIVAGLLDKHRGRHTVRLRPVDSPGLIPTVEIEFLANDKFYRINKRFSDQKGASHAILQEQNEGSWNTIERGDEAFILCRKIVTGSGVDDITGRGGLSNAIKDNLMQVLFPTQGSLVNLTRAPPGIASLGVDKVVAKRATQLGKILSKVTKEMQMWNKPRNGLVKSDLKDHLERLDNIDEEINNLKENSDRIESYVRSIRMVYEGLEGMGDATLHLKEAEKLRKQAYEHRHQRDEAKGIMDESKIEAEKITEILKKRKTLIRSLKDKEDLHERAKEDLKLKEKELKIACDVQNKLLIKKDSMKDEINTLRIWLDFETREIRESELKLSLKSVKSRLDTVDNVQNQLDHLKTNLANLNIPDKKGWSEWDNLDNKLKESKGKMEAEAWQIYGNLPQNFKLKVDDKNVNIKKISKFASTKIEVISPDDKHKLIIEASIRGSDNYDEILETVTDYLQQFNVENIDELRARHSQATSLKTKISGAEGQIKTALDGNTRDELLGEIGRLNGDLKTLKDLGTPTENKPEGSPAEWRIRYEILDKNLTIILSDIGDAKENVGSFNADYKNSKVKVDEIKVEINTINENLESHRKDFGKDENIKSIYDKKLINAKDTLAKWEPLEKTRGFAEEQKLKTAENLVEKSTEAFKMREKVKEIEGRLTELRQKDPVGKLVKLRTEQSQLKSKVSSEQVQADALLLLEQTIQTELQKHTEAVGGPIQEKMNSWLQYILQDDSKLLVSEDGLPTVIRNPSSQDIVFGEQSFGTREQISVLYRLAIAGVIAENSDSGVCLMFDDPFGYTDRERRTRMLEIIEREVINNHHQVLLFTCRPEDFDGYGNHRLFISGTEI